jgi:hypothetical protein
MNDCVISAAHHPLYHCERRLIGLRLSCRQCGELTMIWPDADRTYSGSLTGPWGES